MARVVVVTDESCRAAAVCACSLQGVAAGLVQSRSTQVDRNGRLARSRDVTRTAMHMHDRAGSVGLKRAGRRRGGQRRHITLVWHGDTRSAAAAPEK